MVLRIFLTQTYPCRFLRSMKKIFLLTVLSWISACLSADSDYVATDKIQLRFHGDMGEIDDKQKMLADPAQVRLSIHMDIDQITQVEIQDVSSDMPPCRGGDRLPSPSTLASFNLDPKANMKKIDFRIKLPCAAYYNKFYIQVKVKALGGNYVMKMRFPALIYSPGGGV